MLELLTQFAAESSEKSESGAAVLGIDPLAILLQASTFLILFFLIRRFAWDDIVKNLSDRRKRIEEGLKNADTAEKQLAETEEQTAKALKDARAEADVIIAKANEEAGSIITKAETSAVEKAETILQEAQNKVEADMAKARRELQAELSSLVINATEAVIEEKLDAKQDAKLLDKALEGVES